MAAEHIESVELADINAALVKNLPVHTWGGRLRVQYFSKTTGIAGDATSTINMVKLPAGKVRVLGSLSRLYHSAFEANATIDVGHRAYTKPDGSAVNAVADFFVTDADGDAEAIVSLDEAGIATPVAPLFESKDGVIIFLTSVTAGFAADDVVSGFIVYVVD